jgi:hypothetical protein
MDVIERAESLCDEPHVLVVTKTVIDTDQNPPNFCSWEIGQ